MKKQFYIVMAVFMALCCQAQVGISQAEYFWDTDPGQGNATAVVATDGNFNSAFEELSKTGIAAPSAGLHKFCIRVKDNTGVWGPVFTNVISVVQATTSATMSISQAEYFWDTDPGAGNGAALLAFDGNFDSALEQFFHAEVPVSPTTGLHVFSVRVKDNSGVWGPAFKNVIRVGPALGVDDFGTVAQMKVYPNPVSDILTITFDREISSVTVYNLLGQQVLSKQFKASEAKMDVSGLQAGSYLVKVYAGDQVKTVKVLKQ